jgi:hypothetical protein
VGKKGVVSVVATKKKPKKAPKKAAKATTAKKAPKKAPKVGGAVQVESSLPIAWKSKGQTGGWTAAIAPSLDTSCTNRTATSFNP